MLMWQQRKMPRAWRADEKLTAFVELESAIRGGA
jgi:hypothetical protein